MPPELLLSGARYVERAASVGRLLREGALDAVIVFGPEAQYWLCGYDTFLGALLPQALVFTPDDPDPTLIVWDADVAIAHRTCVVDDVRT